MLHQRLAQRRCKRSRNAIRLLAASELAEVLRALAHPRRIQILEVPRKGERGLASLVTATDLTHSSVSQHRTVLRSHRVVAERREGRRVF